MNAGQFAQYLSDHHDAMVEWLVERVSCGPFDGACVPFARYVQSVIGGDVHVLVDAEDVAQHAVVISGAMLWDAAGPAPAEGMIARFNDFEHARCVGHRSMRAGDLLDSLEMEWIGDEMKDCFSGACLPTP